MAPVPATRPEPNDVPPLGPDDYHELRIHGVAGSSAESMLGLTARLSVVDVRRPVTPDGVEPQPGDISVWRPPHVEPHLRAWSWGSLTSGRWYQAFYLLLLPFMIANLAGWMLVVRHGPTPDGPDGPDGRTGPTAEFRDTALRASAFLVRLVGMLVTVVFVLSAQLLLADVVGWQWLHRDRGWPPWTVGLGTAATVAVFLAVVALTRIRLRPQAGRSRPWDDHRDPVGLGFLSRRQDLLWNSPGINVVLRRLHLTVGTAAVALLAAWPEGRVDGGWATVRLLAFGLGVGAVVLAVAVLARISLGDGTTGVRRVMAFARHGTWPVAALAALLAALFPLGIPPTAGPVTLPALRGAALWVGAAVLAGVLVLAAVGLLTRPGRRVVNAPSLLLLAASVGAALGAGLSAQAARLVGGDCAPGVTCIVVGTDVTWLAIGVTTTLAVLVGVTAGRLAWLTRVHGTWRVAVHHLTGRATWVTALLGACGATLAAAGLVTALVRPGGLPPAEEFPGWAAAVVVALIAGPVLVGAVLLAWNVPGAARRRAGLPAETPTRVWRALGLLAVGGAVALVVLAVVRGWTVSVLGIALPPRTFPEFALDVAVLLPTGALLTRVYTGLTDRGVRRGVGVLWDVGTFWPRWFHPLAPPTYSDRAVRGLVDQLDADLAAGHRLLLAPHSQGAVIAATAVLAGPRRPRLAMLSYGSPWGHLYGEFFPAQVDAVSTAAVAARLDGGSGPRWRNLHRATDPIGGPVVGVDDPDPLDDPHHRGHSDYARETAYHDAVTELRASLDHHRDAPAATGSRT